MKRIVLALGGNALGHTPQQQLCAVKQTAQSIADLAQSGYQVIVGHGNGPQVGMLALAMDFSSAQGLQTPHMPFAECGAMSQGYIGYHLQQAVQNELHARGLSQQAVSVITQVVVNPNDPAFANPVKPIGMFYTQVQAQRLAKEHGFAFAEDAGRGYRRVIASPEPVKIVELPVIRQLVNLHNIVITVGGGGIPVTQTPAGYQGIEAVIDKDKSAAKLAVDLQADLLMIVTAVERVCVHYQQPNQQELDCMTVQQAQEFIVQGHFAQGSMLPKVQACLSFVEQNPGGVAYITALDRVQQALADQTGTKIIAS